MTKHTEPDIALLSKAVQHWYHFYEVPPDDRASDILCHAALDLYRGDIAPSKTSRQC